MTNTAKRPGGTRMLYRFISLICAACAFALVPDANAPQASPVSPQPNIVFILTDDLATNLVQYMPEVQKMMTEGTTFSNYFVGNSLCCPSRATIFTGKYPHNTGVFTNSYAPNKGRLDGGFGAFQKNGDQNHTFALALHANGYKTAMMGKYLNGYSPYDMSTPYGTWGWDEWDVAGEGYPEFNYDLNQDNTVIHYGIDPGDYMTDVLSRLAQNFIKSTTGPFFIEIATFAPHSPYRPAYRDETAFPGAKVPQTNAYCKHGTQLVDPPDWLQDVPACTQQLKDAMDDEFRLRAQSVLAIDRMIQAIRAIVPPNTYIFFSSDNGLHMGDYSLKPGKMTPFDIDIKVPLVVVGPGMKHQVVNEITQTVDLCPTFTDIGGNTGPTQPDGQSLLPLLQRTTPKIWRQMALIERHGPPDDPLDPDSDRLEKASGNANPPNYEALRTDTYLYVEYYDYGVNVSEHGYYDLGSDPGCGPAPFDQKCELANTFKGLSSAQQKKYQNELEKNETCGQPNRPACWAVQQ